MKSTKALLFVAVLSPALANATNAHVNCNIPGPAGKIMHTLKLLDPAGPNTITVSGTCKENLFIQGYDRLSLIAKPGAVIKDASGGVQWAEIYVTDSQRILIHGFTISGGNAGIACNDASLCRLSGNTIEGTLQRGVDINTSVLTFQGDIIQNNTNIGVSVNESIVTGNELTVQSNGGAGVIEGAGTLTGVSWTARNNGNDGIFVATNSHFQLVNSTVSTNAFNGIFVTDLADVSLENDAITGNGYSGVRIGDDALAYFSGGTYTGNSQTYNLLDVGCYGQNTLGKNLSSVTYNTTNCAAPAGDAKKKIAGQD